jgi:hypothetical protein
MTSAPVARDLLKKAAIVCLAILGATLLGSPAHAAATEFFICDCATGAAATCVPGDDTADGTSAAAAWQSFEKARTSFGALAAGDSIRFCRGGAFVGSEGGTRWVNTACRAANPCLIGDYDAPWGDGSQDRPIIYRSGNDHGFALEDGGDADHEEGYRFENLTIMGGGSLAG